MFFTFFDQNRLIVKFDIILSQFTLFYQLSRQNVIYLKNCTSEKFSFKLYSIKIKTLDEISQLEASNLQKTSTISDIQQELTTTKTKLQALETERRELENENLSNNDRNTIMIRSLETQLKTLTSESTAQKSSFETKIDSMTASHEATVNQLKVDFDLAKQTLVDNYESQISSEQVFFNEKILNLEVNLNKGMHSF